MLGGFWNRLGGLLLFLIVLTVSFGAWGPNGPGPDEGRPAAEATR